MSSIALRPTALKIKSVTALAAVIAAVALPQLFHAAGLLSGAGSALGAAFLPMHLPVLLAAFLGGPVVGLTAGIVSPLISFLLSGMPSADLLPFMTLELAGYGLAGGLMYKVKLPVIVKLLVAQLAGRAVRALSVLAAVYLLHAQTVQPASIWNMVTVALPGIVLQWVLIPLLMYRMEGMKKYYV
ncbi:MAG: ECF transporter S component [Clostridiales bacterium]|nr:ECF transporter S component [Clostridiales bacterium]